MGQLNTAHKDKIPKDHSYPLGNKEISDCLEGCEQYKQVLLNFRYQDCYWASEYQRKLKQQDSVTILNVVFNQRDQLWTISVVAIPKEYRNSAHTQLVEKALPIIRSWFDEQSSNNLKGKLAFRYDLYREKLIQVERKC